MQCVSCQFYNMPGLTVCGRCGSQLGLKDLDVDVHPPRASQRPTIFRANELGRLGYSLRDADQYIRAHWFRRGLCCEPPVGGFGLLGRMVVPGWVQFRLGQTARGWAFLGGFLVCFFLSMLFYGTMWSGLLLGLAFSIHLSSILSVLEL